MYVAGEGLPDAMLSPTIWRWQSHLEFLGMGLLYVVRQPFDSQHGGWKPDGPSPKIEFSRVSVSRDDALTLVIDPVHGVPVPTSFCMSTRASHETVEDLRIREGTSCGAEHIGFCIRTGRHKAEMRGTRHHTSVARSGAPRRDWDGPATQLCGKKPVQEALRHRCARGASGVSLRHARCSRAASMAKGFLYRLFSQSWVAGPSRSRLPTFADRATLVWCRVPRHLGFVPSRSDAGSRCSPRRRRSFANSQVLDCFIEGRRACMMQKEVGTGTPWTGSITRRERHPSRDTDTRENSIFSNGPIGFHSPCWLSKGCPGSRTAGSPTPDIANCSAISYMVGDSIALDGRRARRRTQGFRWL